MGTEFETFSRIIYTASNTYLLGILKSTKTYGILTEKKNFFSETLSLDYIFNLCNSNTAPNTMETYLES